MKTTAILKVEIENGEAAPRYCGLYVKNITIAESPDWLKARVTAIGMRPINNIVDITNYVMAELGEPMHAFDRKKLRGDTIFVRMAKEGEKLTTLDDQDHTLTEQDIVIADAGGSIALAGVMGGGDSEIDESTTEIVLEAANFNPVNIRRTAGRYNLRTEAAIRFEKALDPDLCERAILRCYQLIKMLIPEARAATPIVDTYPGRARKDHRAAQVSTSYVAGWERTWRTMRSAAFSKHCVSKQRFPEKGCRLKSPPIARPGTSPSPMTSSRRWDAFTATIISPPGLLSCPALRLNATRSAPSSAW